MHCGKPSSGGRDGAYSSFFSIEPAHSCRFDIESSTEQSVGSHDKAVKCVEWLLERQLVASASWDGSLKVWDVQDSNVSFFKSPACTCACRNIVSQHGQQASDLCKLSSRPK